MLVTDNLSIRNSGTFTYGIMLYMHVTYTTVFLLIKLACTLHNYFLVGTKPSLADLLKFTCTDGKVLNVPLEIATKYVQFGTFLLDDLNGSKIKIMARKHLNNAEQINTEILQEWLNGRGKEPVNWATLVEVLRDIELTALASEIETVKCPAQLASKDIS